MGEGTAQVTQSAATLPTLAQMRARVYAPLRDSERSFVEPWFVDQLLNEAYLDLNARLRFKKGTAAGTTSAAGVITLPSDYVAMENLWVDTDNKPTFTDDYTYLWYKNRAETVSTLARISGNTIETYPALVSLAYSLEYVARPTEMVADSDQPSAITYELVPRIINYARAHCKWQEGEEAEGGKYMALYENGLPGAPRDMYKRRPQQLNMTPELSPFDDWGSSTDTSARHGGDGWGS